jgi:glycosyltransferase involved in cell wall biosynthesis
LALGSLPPLSDPPTITAGLTAFNAADTIEAAMASILAQSLPPIQIVVVDDASTDATAKLLLQYRDDPRVLVLHQECNRGVAAARNRIIAHTKGVFLAFFDDDDISDPRRLELQVQRLLDYERTYGAEAPLLCHTGRQQMFASSRVITEAGLGWRSKGPAPCGYGLARAMLLGQRPAAGAGIVATCTQMGRIDTYRQLGGFDEELRRESDTDLAVRCALAGGQFPGLKAPLVLQRMTASSDKQLATLERCSVQLLQKHRSVFASERLYQQQRQWVRLRYARLGGRFGAVVIQLLGLLLRAPLFTLRHGLQALPNLRAHHARAMQLRSIPPAALEGLNHLRSTNPGARGI